MDDFDALYEILSDPETMKHYPKPYDEAGTNRWLTWSLNNYKEYGFGLWAIEVTYSHHLSPIPLKWGLPTQWLL